MGHAKKIPFSFSKQVVLNQNIHTIIKVHIDFSILHHYNNKKPNLYFSSEQFSSTISVKAKVESYNGLGWKEP